MKNKTLLNFIIITIVINIIFIFACILIVIFGYIKPYIAIFITALMFAYHFDIRIIIGCIVSIFKKRININKKCFYISKKEFERLEKLKVKKWKNNFITLYKNQFEIRKIDKEEIEEVIKNNINAEIVHIFCFIFGLFAIVIGCMISIDEIVIYILTSIFASICFDLPSILIQRYNRYRLHKILNM